MSQPSILGIVGIPTAGEDKPPISISAPYQVPNLTVDEFIDEVEHFDLTKSAEERKEALREFQQLLGGP